MMMNGDDDDDEGDDEIARSGQFILCLTSSTSWLASFAFNISRRFNPS